MLELPSPVELVQQGADGNFYELTDLTVVAEDLKTGDMVEYEVVEGKVMGVNKK